VARVAETRSRAAGESRAESETVAGVSRTDGRRERGRRTRASILATAVDIASVEGLEGLTIGRLAAELRMSKSGLFAHFGSKEELQLAAIDAAREIFIARVAEPARATERGLPRLRALLDAKLAYLRDEAFRGGCFFDAARIEYDSRPTGPVRDAIVKQTDDWLEHLSARIHAAQEEGHVDPDVEPDQLAFEIDALQSAANVNYQLRRDAAVFDRVQRAIEARLGSVTLAPLPAARPRARRGPARDRRARS
jgi:AcrR family transcriptional regulator